METAPLGDVVWTYVIIERYKEGSMERDRWDNQDAQLSMKMEFPPFMEHLELNGHQQSVKELTDPK
jgi:hypothetical protein